ncbi:hypothetical protein KDAU_73010 [Dictyobacter aurantiacus]|uniref:Uncharacterized protein n=1 Tax=Dictyobacter aurantiacus TaxID=1936993 RepID=A0A401ZT37_9CHLR|nr:hypothetical protein KDAU_73010 [Dictyobacter aurantiacus]
MYKYDELVSYSDACIVKEAIAATHLLLKPGVTDSSHIQLYAPGEEWEGGAWIVPLFFILTLPMATLPSI